MIVIRYAVAYLGGAMRPWPPPPRKVRKHFLTRYTLKIGFQTYIFCLKVHSKCRKCRFRDPKFQNGISKLYILLKSALKMQEMPFQRPKFQKISGGAWSPRTPLKLCRHYGLPLTKILATPLVKRGSIIQTFILQRAVTEPFKKQWVRCAHSTLYKPGRFWVTGSLPMAMHCRTTCMINSINTGNTQHGNKRTLDQIHRYSRAKSNSAFYFKNLTID